MPCVSEINGQSISLSSFKLTYQHSASQESCKPIPFSVSVSLNTGSPRILRMSCIPSETAVVAKINGGHSWFVPGTKLVPYCPHPTPMSITSAWSQRTYARCLLQLYLWREVIPPAPLPTPAASGTASFMPPLVPTHGMVWFWGTQRTPRSIVYSAIQLCPDCARLQTAHLHLDGQSLCTWWL